MPLNKETASKIVNLMSANYYTGTARTWAQALAILDADSGHPMDLAPTAAELGASGGTLGTLFGTVAALSLANKQAAVHAGTYPWYMIYSWPQLTGL